MKLRHKMLLFVTPLIILPMMAIGVTAFYKLKQTSEERLNTQVITLLEQISQYVSNKIDVAEANLTLLADNQITKQYALTNDESVRYGVLMSPLLNVFKNIESSLEDYYEIRFILIDGYEDARWANENINNLNESISHESYFKELQSSNEKIFKKIIVDENTQQYAVLIIHKVNLWDPAVDSYGTAPKLRGYLAITVSLKHLKSEINKNVIGKSGFMSVVDDDGNIIFTPEKQTPLNSSILSFKNNSIMSFLSNRQSTPLQTSLSNTPVLLHSKKLFLNLNLLGILPKEEILNSSRELSKIILVISLLAILSSIFLVYFSLRKIILQPIQKLNKAAHSIGQGNLNSNINIKSNDEIGVLAKSFQTMSQNLKQIHEEVNHSANHDSLTGLPNRSMFMNYLTETIATSKKQGQKSSLLFLDLDDFKNINDTLGHQAGDILLQEIASRLSTTLRKSESLKSKNTANDLVARLGGDEFIILLNDIDGPFDATAVADRVLKKLQQPISIFDNQVYANCSIGITLYPDDAEDADNLIKNADIAMYHAKEQGKNHYQFYSNQLNTDMQKRLIMNANLRVALENDFFFIHYQPKVDAQTGNIIGLEALLRWQDSELGMVSPEQFIPVAEESGLITPITEWVFNEVCKQCIAWQEQKISTVPIAVNVSSIQFKRRDLVDMIKTSLQRTGLAASNIEIELTETSLLDDTTDAIQILNGLNQLGINVALDDFGTGYSSLNYLNQLPIHTLKIDRSFVHKITSLDHEYAIVDAIIALAHALDLQVVAEGVETTTQLEYLKLRNCDVIQGYLFSKPLPANEIADILKQTHPATLTPQ